MKKLDTTPHSSTGFLYFGSRFLQKARYYAIRSMVVLYLISEAAKSNRKRIPFTMQMIMISQRYRTPFNRLNKLVCLAQSILCKGLFYIFIVLAFAKCNDDNLTIEKVVKYFPNDPFREKMVQSQFFTFDASRDTILIGEMGTRIVIPAGSFLDANGKSVLKSIQLELAEALAIDQMMLSNLTTISNGKPIETAGMFYLNATLNGEQLKIDEENPLYVEVPAERIKENMMIYEGLRDENGNINWTDPETLAKFLIPVDMNLLDFYPPRFEKEVDAGLPFRNHQLPSKELTDSLYYSLSVTDASDLTNGLSNTSIFERDLSDSIPGDPVHWTFSANFINDTIYDLQFNAAIDNGWMLEAGQNVSQDSLIPLKIWISKNLDTQTLGKLKVPGIDPLHFSIQAMDIPVYKNTVQFKQRVNVKKGTRYVLGGLNYLVMNESVALPPRTANFKIILNDSLCGIDPAIIKVIRDKKFQNSLIATRAFETRLQTIFETCQNDIINIYINNLDKEMWVLDSMATARVQSEALIEKFRKYENEKLTNVEGNEKYAAILSRFYKRELTKVKAELNEAKHKMMTSLREKNQDAQKVIANYKAVLKKRETYRMKSYGFTLTKSGWVNIDRGTNPKDWEMKAITVSIVNSDFYDQLNTYTVGTSRKTLLNLEMSPQNTFRSNSSTGNTTPIAKTGKNYIVSIGYKANQPYFGMQQVTIEELDEPVELELLKSTKLAIRDSLSAFDDFITENNIEKDQEYAAMLETERKRQEKLKIENEYIRRLQNVAFPCCTTDGMDLFIAHCSSCHNTEFPNTTNIQDIAGLGGITSKHSMDWLIAWTKDAYKLKNEGDPEATEILKLHLSTWGGHPPFRLSDEEIKSIYEYIEQQAPLQ